MAKDRKQRYWVTALVSVIVLAALVFILIKAAWNKKNELSLTRYAIVNTTGIDGYGTASVKVDTVGLLSAIKSIKKDDGRADEYQAFVDTVSFSIDKESSLSNGDRLELAAEYDTGMAEKLGLNIKDDKAEVAVSALNEGTVVDAFEDVKIVTGGISPYVYVTYVNESQDSYLAELEYKIDKTSGLAIGDTIKITCMADDKTAAEHGFFINNKQKEYTISEADSYISDIADVDEDTLARLDTTDLEVIKEKIEDTTSHMSYELTGDKNYLFSDNNETAVGFTRYKAFLGYNNTGSELKHENYLVMVYKGQVGLPTYADSGEKYRYLDAYFAFLYTDVIKTRDDGVTLSDSKPENRCICAGSYEALYEDICSHTGSEYDLTDE